MSPRSLSREPGFQESRPLLASEAATLANLRPVDIDRLRALSSENLTKERHKILGIRSEDLYFFLTCIKQGFIPVTPHELMGKTGESHLYLTPNPESSLLISQGYWDGTERMSTFEKTVQGNIRMYGNIAQVQAIHRCINSLLIDRDEKEYFNDAIREYTFHYYGQGYYREATEMDLGSAGESYFKDLLKALLGQVGTDNAFRSETVEILRLFVPALNTTHRQSFKALISDLPNRGGLCLAFSADLAHDFADESDMADGGELLYRIPGGKLPLEYLVGFEALGHHEDDALERLGV